MKRMKIFVTGGGGFVGANLVRRLLGEGHELHLSLREKKANWRLAEVEKELNIYPLDITDLPALRRAMLQIKPEAIVHLATYGAYPTIQKEMDRIVQTNLIGTINLVKACDEIKYECFINTSSSSEYGVTGGKMSEKDYPRPIDYYGAAKAGATIFCQTHARITKRPIVSTRLFSVYGPYEEPLRLVPSTIKKCLTGQKLEFTAGEQGRDFIYTEDIEDAYLELLKRPELGGEVINIGTGKQHTVREMVGEIVRESGTKMVPQWGALKTRETEVFNWVADVEKAERLLKWRPKNTLRDGVHKSVEWMRSHLQLYEQEGG